eukprot:6740293-Pyramimonas_sp.AAC.1
MPELPVEAHSVKDHYPRKHSYGFVVLDPTVQSGPNEGGNIAPHRVNAASIILPALVAPAHIHNLNRPLG